MSCRFAGVGKSIGGANFGNGKSEVPTGHLSGDVKNYSCLCESGGQGRRSG